MGVQEIIAASKKKILQQKNEELDKLIERLTEVEEQIRQENLVNNIMPDEVDELLQDNTIKNHEKEQEENSKKFRDREAKRKELEDEERQLEESFSKSIQGSVGENKKIFGYLKRYIIIGMVTGFPGIALAYLFDKWQENNMIKELYQAHINTIVYPNNAELQRIYQQKRNEFCRVYNIDKIEKMIKESELIANIKNDRDELIKLNKEINFSQEMYQRTVDVAIDEETKIRELEEEEEIKNQEEMDQEFELELKQS